MFTALLHPPPPTHSERCANLDVSVLSRAFESTLKACERIASISPHTLQDSLDASFKASNPREVYEEANTMLGKLGDPFTRVIPPEVQGAFENVLEGQVVGVGFQVPPLPPIPVVHLCFLRTPILYTHLTLIHPTTINAAAGWGNVMGGVGVNFIRSQNLHCGVFRFKASPNHASWFLRFFALLEALGQYSLAACMCVPESSDPSTNYF